MQLTRNPRAWTLRLSAVLVAFLVLLPSLCSARCSAHWCTPAFPQSPAEDCHHASAPDFSAGIKLASAPEPCASAEILSTVPRSISDVYAASSADNVSFCPPSALDLSAPGPFAANVLPINTSPQASPPLPSVPLRI